MAKLTKAQAKRRLREAEEKFKKVFMYWVTGQGGVQQIVTTSDMVAVSKIVDRCVKRIR